MPTALPRHQVTETPAVARALDRAARRWPEASRGQLLVRLVETGAAVLEADDQGERERRARLVETLAARYATAFPKGYLAELREDWQE